MSYFYKLGYRMIGCRVLLQSRPTRTIRKGLKHKDSKDSIKRTTRSNLSTRKKVVNQRAFTIVYEKAPEGGYTGRVLELEGTRTEGETKQELIKNMFEAIQLTLDYLESKSRNEQKFVIEMPA
jgi:predicted RNase H-like HicB family nuclease